MSLVRAEAKERNALSVELPPDWSAVKTVWEPCRELLRQAGLGSDEAYALAMVAQELLENAVKYGAPDAGESIRLSLRVDPEDVTVEVRSRAGLDDAFLKTLDRTVQWIRSFQDPFEAYVERLKQVALRPYDPGQSGLGLARIAYEGRCALDFYVDAGSTLAVSAVYRREGGGACPTR